MTMLSIIPAMEMFIYVLAKHSTVGKNNVIKIMILIVTRKINQDHNPMALNLARLQGELDGIKIVLESQDWTTPRILAAPEIFFFLVF